MDSEVEIYMERANSEILAGKSLKKLSEDSKSKEEFEIPSASTFYSSVISHCYYAIFYSAKAILLSKGVRTSSPNVHKRTLEEFEKNLIVSGEIDKKLLEIYEEAVVRASELLEIFKDEKWKRGNFTYRTIPQANKVPAEESLRNAGIFISNITKVLEGENE